MCCGVVWCIVMGMNTFMDTTHNGEQRVIKVALPAATRGSVYDAVANLTRPKWDDGGRGDFESADGFRVLAYDYEQANKIGGWLRENGYKPKVDII